MNIPGIMALGAGYSFLVYLLSRAELPGDARRSAPAAALILFLFVLNICGYIFPFPYVFWIAGGISLALAWALRSKAPATPGERLSRGYLVLALVLALFFGVYFFTSWKDDPICHYPIINSIARGNLPVKSITNPDRLLDYHYGYDLAAGVIRYFSGVEVETASDWTSWLFFIATLLLVINLAQKIYPGRFYAGAVAVLLFFLGSGLFYLSPINLKLGGTEFSYGTGLVDSLGLRIGSNLYFYPLRTLANHSYLELVLRKPVSLAYLLFCFLSLGVFQLSREPQTQGFPFYFWMLIALALSGLAAEEIFGVFWGFLAIYLLLAFFHKTSPSPYLPAILLLSLILLLFQGGIFTSYIFSPPHSTKTELIKVVNWHWPPGFTSWNIDYPLASGRGVFILLAEFSPFFWLFPLVLLLRRDLFIGYWVATYLFCALISLLFRFRFSPIDQDRFFFLASALANFYGPLALIAVHDRLKTKLNLKVKKALAGILLLSALTGPIVMGLLHIVMGQSQPSFYAADKALAQKVEPHLLRQAVILSSPEWAPALGRLGYFSLYQTLPNSFYFQMDEASQQWFLMKISPATLKYYHVHYLIFNDRDISRFFTMDLNLKFIWGGVFTGGGMPTEMGDSGKINKQQNQNLVIYEIP